MICPRKSHRPVDALLTLILFLGSLGRLFADSLPVAADAHVNSTFPTVNFGNAPFLQIGETSRTYVRFDLSSLPATASDDIAKVNLVLWVGRTGSLGSLQVSEAAGAWDEAGITWNSQPPAGGV